MVRSCDALLDREFTSDDLESLDRQLRESRPANYRQMDVLRSTARWVAGVFSGAAVLLVARVDLEGIGSLNVCNLLQGFPSGSTCGRFYIAVGSAMLIVVSVLVVVWLLVGVFNPQDTTLHDYAVEKASWRIRRVNRWFKEHPGFVIGDPEDDMPLQTLYRATRKAHALVEASKDQSEMDRANATFRGLELHSYLALETARYEHLRQRLMGTVMPVMLVASVLVAVGLLVLIWATHPPGAP